MGGAVGPVVFDPDGYDARAIARVLYPRLVPAWLRYRGAMAVGLMLLVVALVAAMGRAGVDYGTQTFVGGIVLTMAATGLADGLHRKRLRAARRASSLRSGPSSLSLQDHGLVLATPASRSVFYWAHLLDVVETGDGLLIRLGPVDAIAVPAGAFADPQARATFVAGVRARIATARNPSP